MHWNPVEGGEAPQSPVAAPAPHFDVLEYRVLGNTVLSNRDIEGVLYPRLGPDKTFADVDAARAALEAAYHALGYATVFVDVPPQEVTDGIVRLHVTEGRLRERTISGAHYFSEREILQELPATTPGTVPKLSELQQELNQVNTQTADRSVVPVLKAGPVPGTMDLGLKVDDRVPLHASLELNNQSTPDTEPLRATASISYNNLFEALDSLSAQYTTTPQKSSEVGVFNAAYGLHPFAGGLRPSLSFTNSSSNVATVGTLGVLGKGQVVSGRVVAPLLQAAGDTQLLTFGLDYKHFRNTIGFTSALDTSGSGGPTTVIEPISYVNASIGYSGSWQYVGASGTVDRFDSLDVSANFGPRGLVNSPTGFAASRYQGRANYAYLRADAAWTVRLPLNLHLTLRAAGQAALEPLVAYEQQSIAGADGVRGYLEAEDLGDNAVKGTVQLQLPPLTRHGFTLGDLFVFFDGGQSHIIEALQGESSHTDLRSAGAGIDLLPGYRVYGSLTWADPLLPGPRTQAHDGRWLFDLKGSL
jgi:hemolysin activation/secretion protein